MSDTTPQTDVRQLTSKVMRGAIWIAIGSLIAAALVCVVWVLIGDQDGIIGRAFLTILLLAVFAGIAIAEANLAAHRPDWLALSSMVTWIVALLVGAVKIWLPDDSLYGGWAMGRFMQLIVVVAILQLALVHARLYLKASRRYVTTFTRVIVIVTFAFMALLVAMLVFYLTFPDQFDYRDLYWRVVIALAILVAVGTTLIPLLNALFAPRPRPVAPARPTDAHFTVPTAPAQPTATWPTYADGRTPLPVMPDGSPDWNAYYTGYPTYPAPTTPALTPPGAVSPTPPASAPSAPPAPGAPPAEPAPAAPDVPPASAPSAPSAPPAESARPAPGASPDVPPAPPAYGAFPPPPPVPPAPGQPGPGQ